MQLQCKHLIYTILQMIDYSYLTPPNKVKRIKLAPNQIYEQLNGKHLRRIFNGSNYQQFERDAIHKLKQHLHMKAPNIQYSDQLLLRFTYAGHFLLSQVIERVKLFQQWHQNQVIVTLNKIGREILQHGHIYAYGRDYDYCPLIIVKATKIDFKKYQISNYLNAIANLLQPLEQFMLVGGVIQKWNIIVDFQFKKNVYPLQVLMNLKKISYAYPFRLKRLMFVNVHSSNEVIIRQVQEILKEQESQALIQIIKNMQQLNRYINTQERQIKYGGNLLNVCEFWPIHTTNKYQQTQSEFNTEYESVNNDPQFFEQHQAPAICDLSNSSCDIY